VQLSVALSLRIENGGMLMEWMLLPLKRYADFSGRSRRMEYWMFTLGILIAELLLVALLAAAGSFAPENDNAPSVMGLLVTGVFFVFVVAIIVPSLAVQVRRFHDLDKSGWSVLLAFIPFVGGLIVLVFMCMPGTRGPNRFGDDPLDPEGQGSLGDVFR
jgi:uncharacterized membrane protein YhaH (DUF805 family)